MSVNKQPSIMRISVKLPEEMWQQISHLAVDRRTSVQALAQEALGAYLIDNRDAADVETTAA